MKQDRKTASVNLAKNTAILTFGMVCTQGLGFFLLPLYTSILDTREYGTYDLLITYGILLLPLVGAQFEQGMFRFMLDIREEKEKITELFSTVLAADLVHIMIYLAGLKCLSMWISIPYVSFLMAHVCLQVLYALMQQFVRGLGKSRVYAVAGFLSAGMTIVLNVILLVVLKTGLEGMFLSVLISAALAIVYMCVSVRVWKYFDVHRISRRVRREIRKYSLPLIPNNLSWWIIDVSDRTVITWFLGVEFTGIYTVANKFSNVFITLYNVFNVSWTETVALYYGNEDQDVFLSDMITRMYRLFSALCFGIVAFMPFVFPVLVNERYQAGYPQVIILMYAMLLRVVVGLYSCIYVAMKASGKIAETSAIAAAINVAVNVLLIGKIGIYAASVSTFAAFGIMTVVRCRDINKTMNVHIEKKTLVCSVAMAVLLAVCYLIGSFGLNICAAAISVLYAFVMNKDLIKSVLDIIKKRERT